jgi:hypothetical protein
VDEIVRELRERKLKRVALFGTRFTMETGLFGRLQEFELVKPRHEGTPEQLFTLDRLLAHAANRRSHGPVAHPR